MLLSKVDVTAIDSTFENIRKIWLARRRAGNEICNIVLEANQVSKEAAKDWLEEEHGIEFDDDRLDQLVKAPQSKKIPKRKL